MTDWPRPLADAHGPIREDKLDGAAEGMGDWGAETRALAADGISAEVIDPRSLVPLDREALLSAVARTGRLVIAEPANRTCGAAAEISALAAEEVFDQLRAPVLRVTTPDIQIPFSPPLEAPLFPDADKLVAAVHKLMGVRA